MHRKMYKSILSSQNGMNIYRGCLHGCIYCDSRSNCYQMDHAFEDIEIKENAVELLEDSIKHKRKKCMIGTGSMCDPYMPIEKDLKLMRSCLEVIAKYEFGATIITKSDLVLRDLDLFEKINKQSKCVIQMTLTTYNDDLCKIIEPNVCVTSKRYEALKVLQEHGIPTVVWFSPILPYINDTKENIRGIMSYCVDVGVKGIICFGMGLTLRDGDREYFYKALDNNFSGLKSLYQKNYGTAYEISSPKNNELMKIIHEICRKHNIMDKPNDVFAYLHEYQEKQNIQLSLF